MKKIQGGYVLISVGQFANVCAAKREGEISFLALRVWLAAHEQRAKRCTAKRRRFSALELAQLVRANLNAVQRALKQLSALGLISWSETNIEFPRSLTLEGAELAADLGTSPMRPVPVPRRILRALFRHTRPAEVLAGIAHLIRCLFIRGGEIKNGGLVKASWIASTFSIAERSVHSARKWLLSAGFLAQEEVHQLVKNRWGGKFLFRIEAAAVRVRSVLRKGRFAPPSKTKSTSKSTSNNQINYKPAFAASGVQREHTPTLKNIQPDDLKKPARLEALYRQAVSAGWIIHSEASVRNFAAAAVRASRAGGRVGAIFAGIVKRKLWHHVTQEQEDRALFVLRRNAHLFDSGAVALPSETSPIASVVKPALAKSLVPGARENPVQAEADRRKLLLQQARMC